MGNKEIERQSEILCEKLLQTDRYRSAAAVYVYLSYNQEVRTRKIMEAAWKEGKKVAVPKVFGETMRFIEITPDSKISKGAFGIPEPVSDSPCDDIPGALVIMPGLAFDPDGHRCGYGGGFYDKYLEANPGHPTIAMCYDFQLLDYIETEAHDLPVDEGICTKA